MNVPRLCMIACLACAMLGCGQKGPLLLPDTPRHKRTAPKPPDAPAPADAGTTPSQSTPPQP